MSKATDLFSFEAIQTAANNLGWQPEMVRALATKEVTNDPFFTSKGQKKQKILFERHKFWRHLIAAGIDPRALLRSDPSLADILSPSPYKVYGKFAEQYERRDRAANIHKDSAWAATSYTCFQILGENFAGCGYRSVTAFVESMDEPDNWLSAMVALVKAKGVAELLQPQNLDKQNFALFSAAWNGPNYQKNNYDVELSRIYQRELAASLPRQESVAAALVQSKTVRRTAATVAAGTAPSAGIVLQSQSVTDLLNAAQDLTTKSQEIGGQISTLKSQAALLAGQLDWLPWAVGGQTVLVLLLAGLVIYRYLNDRGYLQ